MSSILLPAMLSAQTKVKAASSHMHKQGMMALVFFIISCLLCASLLLLILTNQLNEQYKKKKEVKNDMRFIGYMKNLDSSEIEEILLLTDSSNNKQNSSSKKAISTHGSLIKGIILITALFSAEVILAQSPATKTMIQEPGIIITLVLLFIPILGGIVIMIIK